ncbi:MAG: hypothetical protein NTV94_04595, partial [Planctomycetota bacterium]|nr:hypothetical protein [Planctomycetota bacterium]
RTSLPTPNLARLAACERYKSMARSHHPAAGRPKRSPPPPKPPQSGGPVPVQTNPAPSWVRPAILIPIGLSVAVHAAMLVVIDRIRLEPPQRITDAPSLVESSLTLATPAPPPTRPSTPEPTPAPPPAPKPPDPVPTAPEPKAIARAPEPELAPPPAPAPSTLTLFDSVKEAPAPTAPQPAPAPTAPPAPAPTPARPATFAGVAAKRAATLVYAIDASGAMTTSLPYVKEELLRSVSRLDQSQRFQVIVFRQLPGAAEISLERFSTEGFADTHPGTIAQLSQWIAAIQPRGRSQPLAGLRAALTLEPELVFFLTRSIRRSGTDTAWGEGTQATLEELDRLNPKDSSGARAIVIKALQFIDPDPTGMLQQIGAAHGDGPGSYTVVKP